MRLHAIISLRGTIASMPLVIDNYESRTHIQTSGNKLVKTYEFYVCSILFLQISLNEVNGYKNRILLSGK